MEKTDFCMDVQIAWQTVREIVAFAWIQKYPCVAIQGKGQRPDIESTKLPQIWDQTRVLCTLTSSSIDWIICRRHREVASTT